MEQLTSISHVFSTTVGTIWKVIISKKRVKYVGKVYGKTFTHTADMHCGFKDGHNSPDYLMLVDL
jgi:hypothetical protein